MKFRVYVEQINQTMYQIQAKSKEEAAEKAQAKWLEENKRPSVYIEEIKHG